MDSFQSLAFKKVWHNGRHNAFTHLVNWKGNLYLVFRTASNHLSADGRLTLLCSQDNGENWQQIGDFPSPTNKDFRDPKLLATPDKLYIHAFDYDRAIPKKDGYVLTSKNGKDWSMPVRISDEDDIVVWWPGYYNGKFYGTGYKYGRTKEEIRTIFLTSDDGLKWDKVSVIYDMPHSNEASFFITKDDEAHVLVRTPDLPVIARSYPPYTNWSIEKLPRVIQGFAFEPYKDGYLIIGRVFEQDQSRKTALLTWQQGKLELHKYFPSGGDTSYPGIVQQGEKMLVSYYSSHEYEKDNDIHPADIYLVEIHLK